MCMSLMGASEELVKVTSTEIMEGEKMDTVRVNLYVADKPPPVTRLSSSNDRVDTGTADICA